MLQQHSVLCVACLFSGRAMYTMLYIQFDNRVVADRVFFAVHLRYSEDNMYKPAT
jgi:hypothetical protein